MADLIPVLSYDRVVLCMNNDPTKCLCQGKSDNDNFLYIGNTNIILFTIISNQQGSTQFDNLSLVTPNTSPSTNDTFSLNMTSLYGSNKSYQVSTNTNYSCEKLNIPALKSPVTNPANNSFQKAQWFIYGTNTTSSDTNIYYGTPYSIYSYFYEVQKTSQSAFMNNSSTCKTEDIISLLTSTTIPSTGIFYFLNYNLDVPTRPTSVLCCTTDPDLGANAESYCGSFWGSGVTCDSLMTSYCAANPQDTVCACENSQVPLAQCFDAACSNNSGAYRPSTNPKNCPGGCITLISAINKGNVNKLDIDNASFCQYCSKTNKKNVTGIACPTSSDTTIYWIIGIIAGVIIIILIIAVLIYFLRRKGEGQD
jgi:hypothetical protein